MSDPAEIEARAQLAAMAPRLREAPHALLDVAADAPPAALRAAFLRLTKQYHPTKYARFSPDVVRLANEVFLTIKRAYDQLSAPAKVAAGTGSVASRPAGSTAPPVRATTPPHRPSQPLPRAPTVPATSTPRAPTAPVGAPPATPRPRADTPVGGTPKVSFNPPTSPPAKPTQPPPVATPPTRSRPSSAPPPPRALTPLEQQLEPSMELLRRKLWADARQALLKLAVAQPQEKKFRAYMHYARGRESLDAGRPDEARAEWNRALGLDPDLAVVKRALDELPPEPTSGPGLLGRLFGKK